MVAVYMYMRLLGYPAEKISILTTYNGQKHLIRDVINQRCANNPAIGLPCKVRQVTRPLLLGSEVTMPGLGSDRSPDRSCWGRRSRCRDWGQTGHQTAPAGVRLRSLRSRSELAAADRQEGGGGSF